MRTLKALCTMAAIESAICDDMCVYLLTFSSTVIHSRSKIDLSIDNRPNDQPSDRLADRSTDRPTVDRPSNGCLEEDLP